MCPPVPVRRGNQRTQPCQLNTSSTPTPKKRAIRKGAFKAGGITALFDGDDGVAGHADGLAQRRLADIAMRLAQVANPVADRRRHQNPRRSSRAVPRRTTACLLLLKFLHERLFRCLMKNILHIS
jgi:hypothetical protein